MENVFIDTCVYEEGQFVGSGILKTLFEAAKEGRILILLPEVTEREVLAHIHSKVTAEQDKLMKLSASLLKHLDSIKQKLEEAVKASASAAQEMENAFLEELRKACVCRIPLQTDLDLRSIVDAYFRQEPPFSQKKKAEFPDAIVLKSLEQWCEKKGTVCTVLSRDVDMKNYHSDCLVHKNVDEYTADLAKRAQREKQQREEESKRIRQNAYQNLLSDSAIIKRLKHWVHDLLDNDMLYSTALQIEEINDFSINEQHIDFLDECKLVGMYDGYLVHRVHVEATTDISVNHPDYDTAYYDGEDKRWYFIDEAIDTPLTSILEFDMDFTTDENGENPDIDSINSGRRLSERVIINSICDSLRQE